ncbi:MAG: methyltransferase [Caulobacteraceae bacterium]|nr:methyltransferase [Caulobacteraceae bacterium]
MSAPQAIEIDDPDDPRVAAYREIKERDLVGRQGRFIAEGEVVLRLLLRSAHYRPLSLLIDRKRVPALAPLLEQVPELVPIYAAGQDALDAIAGFHLHRGILALGEAAPSPGPDQLLAAMPDRALVLALVGIGNHDNMGGLMRNAAAFGANLVLIDSGCCDPLYRKAIRVSVGASLILPWARVDGGGEAMLSLLQAAGFEVLAFSPAGAEPLASLAGAPRAAVMLGPEGPGLSASLLAKTRTVSIEMAPGFDSLNVATAGAIALHHLMRGTGRG